MTENKKPEYALGSQKIVRTFEHMGKDGQMRKFVRIESQLGWTREEAQAIFHMARIAYLLFPENIPYPRLIRKSSTKTNTYSIFAEFIEHDEKHEFITEHRNNNAGFINSDNKEFFDKYKEYKKIIEDSTEFKELMIRMIDAGLITYSKMYELTAHNVIFSKNGSAKENLLFVDFNSPFYVGKNVFDLKFDILALKKYVNKHCAEEIKRKIQRELWRLFDLIPDELYKNVNKKNFDL